MGSEMCIRDRVRGVALRSSGTAVAKVCDDITVRAAANARRLPGKGRTERFAGTAECLVENVRVATGRARQKKATCGPEPSGPHVAFCSGVDLFFYGSRRLDVVVMLAVTLESRAVERLLVVGVSDADDQPRALLKRASVQVHGSVLGNEPVDVRARRDDAGSERQLGRDLADALVRGPVSYTHLTLPTKA